VLGVGGVGATAEAARTSRAAQDVLPIVTMSGHALPPIAAEYGSVQTPWPARISWSKGKIGRSFEVNDAAPLEFVAFSGFESVDANGLPKAEGENDIAHAYCGEGLRPSGCTYGTKKGHTVVSLTEGLAKLYWYLELDWKTAERGVLRRAWYRLPKS